MAVIQRPEAVGDIQEILNKLGYDTGTVDGMWGRDTSAGFNHFVRDVQSHVFPGQPDQLDGLYGENTHKQLVEHIEDMYGDRLSAEERTRLTAALAAMTEKVDPNGNPHPLGRSVINRVHQPAPLEDFESHITPRVTESAPTVDSTPITMVAPETDSDDIAVETNTDTPVDVRAVTALPEQPAADAVPEVPAVTAEALLNGMADIEARQTVLMHHNFLGSDPAEGVTDARAQARVVNMRDPENFDKMRELMLERGDSAAVAMLDEFKTLEQSRQRMQTDYEAMVPAIEMETPAATPEGVVDMGQAFDAAASLTGNPAVIPEQHIKLPVPGQ